MIVSCIGDSLTEGDYGVFGKSGIANVHKENYPFFLSKNTGWTVRNFGKCGYKASNWLNDFKKGLFDVSNSDVILIMLGTNGGNSVIANTTDNDAYREIISECNKKAPRATIILITPPHVTENPFFSNCGYINNVISGRDFTIKLSKEKNLPLIDTANISEFNAENEAIYQSNDGLHFVEKGYIVLADFIEKETKKIIAK